LKTFELLNNLSNVYRWNNCYCSKQENVLEHSGFVSLYALRLGIKHDVLSAGLLIKALVHDLDEAITGDIVTPTKYSSVDLLNQIKLLESRSSKKISDEYFDGKVFDYWVNSKDITSIEGSIVKLADSAAVVYKIWQEYNNGNKSFGKYIPNIRKSLEHSIEVIHHELYDDVKELIEFLEDIK
jgi:putative hydrolase of HD superfamily